jgi:cytochrome P450
MHDAVKEAGIPASFEPVDWNPPGLPTDPDEIVSAVMGPSTRGELYPLYHQLRRVAPVHHCAPELFHGAWALTRFADVDELFKSTSAVNDPAVVEEAFHHTDGPFYDVMRHVMVFLEPEPHQRIRRLVWRAFTPRAIASWRPIAEAVANELCDAVEGDGGMELVEQYDYELPFNVIAHILGVPRADFPRVKQLAWDFARAGEKVVNDEVAQRGDEAAQGLIDYFTELVERRRADPRADDLLSTLIEAEDDGDRLSHMELIANCILLMQAGHETTQDLIGNAMVALFRSPGQLALLRDNPELTKNAVEEFLRYDASVQINHRVLLSDTTVGDVTIPAGEMAYVFLGAVNRDPAFFPEPDTLDVTRDISHHVAFSFGAYYCIGAALARTETAVAVRTLLDRFPGLRPEGDGFEWRNTLQLRGPQRVEVVW